MYSYVSEGFIMYFLVARMKDKFHLSKDALFANVGLCPLVKWDQNAAILQKSICWNQKINVEMVGYPVLQGKENM